MADSITVTPTTQTITVTPAGGTTTTIQSAPTQTVTVSSTTSHYTDEKAIAAARGAISITGGVGLSYNSTTGVITSLSTSASTATLGIAENNIPKFTTNVSDNDFLRIDGTSVEGRSASELLSDIGAAAAAHTHADAYTGQIETAADKTYTIDPGAVSARTITGFHIKSASGTCTATLKVGSNVVKAASVSSSSGDQSSLANTSVSVDAVITLVVSSNSSALDVIFSVEYTA